MIFETFPVGLLQCNCAILGDERTREAIVVDPGDEVERILAVLRKHDLKLRKIVNTHSHIDHVGANAELREHTGAEVCLHKADLFLFENLKMQAAKIGLPAPASSKVDAFLEPGDVIECGSMRFGVLHTPGHTPGSLAFETELEAPKGEAGASLVSEAVGPKVQPAARPKGHQGLKQVLFTGDTLFAGSIGRANPSTLYQTHLASVRTRVLTLPDDLTLFPGHGPATTVREEKAHNPFG